MKINIDVADGQSGDWKVETFEITERDAKFNNMRAAFSRSTRYVKEGVYKRLKRNGTVVMSNTPVEIDDFRHFIFVADGDILINGLGLGCVIKGIYDRKERKNISSITVIEKSLDVINLVAPYYKYNNLEIIYADAFEYKPPKGNRYDFVWHDIWDYICSDNLEEMTKLHRKYGKKTDWQDSWCKVLCKRNKAS